MGRAGPSSNQLKLKWVEEGEGLGVAGLKYIKVSSASKLELE